jgi:hypothetical protein
LKYAAEAAVKIETTLYVRVGTAAALADVSRFWMLQHVKAGKIPGVAIDGQWFVLRSAAQAFSRHPTAGRPASPATLAKRAQARRRIAKK